jgi:uncharacterized protein (TIGR02284 family)
METAERTMLTNETAAPIGNLTQTLNRLIQRCIESDKSLYGAAEYIGNRGMKLLLKTYAQQHSQFTAQLQDIVKQMGDTPPENRDAVAAVGRGLSDVKAAMTVQRQSRQKAVLDEALQSEATTATAYADALQTTLPDQIRQVVTRHAEQIRTIQHQIKWMAGEANRRLVIRLYNRAGEAEEVTRQLQQAGFTPDEIYATKIEQVARVYTGDTQERGRSRRQTIVAMGLAGAGVGLVLGLLLGIFQNLLAPNTVGFLPAGGIGAVVIVSVIGAVIGAIFGLIFGLLIGQDKTEDDAYLYTESLKDGDTLVVVFTDSRNKAAAERIVGLKHQREIQPKPA